MQKVRMNLVESKTLHTRKSTHVDAALSVFVTRNIARCPLAFAVLN